MATFLSLQVAPEWPQTLRKPQQWKHCRHLCLQGGGSQPSAFWDYPRLLHQHLPRYLQQKAAVMKSACILSHTHGVVHGHPAEESPPALWTAFLLGLFFLLGHCFNLVGSGLSLAILPLCPKMFYEFPTPPRLSCIL